MTNHFEIWGESYAGIYIPMLADLVLNASRSGGLPKLAGIGVGNGCLGDEVGSCSPQGTKIEVDFLYGHGAISQPTYAALYAECPDFTNPSALCEFSRSFSLRVNVLLPHQSLRREYPWWCLLFRMEKHVRIAFAVLQGVFR